jgi:uncharacterized protein YbaP (TraB family)
MKAAARLSLVAIALSLPFQSAAAASQSPSAHAQEIVVMATRSGIPVWRVDGPGSTLILVGTISDVSKDTHWDPASLLTAIRKADRVMFPASVQFQASLFSALGWAAKSRRMAILPKGHTIAEYVSAPDYQRLVRLQQQGILKAGFEREHPLQIIQDLFQYASGERPSVGFFSISKVHAETDPDAFVREAVRKYKIPLVPLRQAKLKPVVAQLFNSGASEQAPCLRAAMALAEAGQTAMPQRSAAWAQRRVATVLNSPAQRALDACRPTASAPGMTPEIRTTVRSLLAEKPTTLAVFDLPLLARPGGLFDELSDAGFEIRGPAWK